MFRTTARHTIERDSHGTLTAIRTKGRERKKKTSCEANKTSSDTCPLEQALTAQHHRIEHELNFPSLFYFVSLIKLYVARSSSLNFIVL